MSTTHLHLLVDELLAHARTTPSGRAARTVHGGREHALRQTVIGLVEGHALGEHASPGEATLHVLTGQVRLGAGDEHWVLTDGDHVAIPDRRHDLLALTDAVVLLTVVA